MEDDTNIKSPDHGLYRVHWLSGGDSLAAIGSYSDGRRWIAPTNWVGSPDKPGPGALYDPVSIVALERLDTDKPTLLERKGTIQMLIDRVCMLEDRAQGAMECLNGENDGDA